MRGLLIPSVVHVAGPPELGHARAVGTSTGDAAAGEPVDIKLAGVEKAMRLRVRCLRCDGLLYSGLQGETVPWKLGQFVLETEDDGVTRFQLRESTSPERLAGERVCTAP